MPSVFKVKKLDPKKRRLARKHEVFRVGDVPRIAWSAGAKFAGIVRPLGEFGRRERIGVHLEEVPPGKWNSTFHWHSLEEEHFWILEGEGIFRIGRRRVKTRAGDYVVFPPDGRVAHALQNTGRRMLKYVVIGTREKGDVCVYPDSGKISVRQLKKVGRLTVADYWDGEV